MYGAPMTFAATRAAASARLDEFLPFAGRAYAANRNTDRGPDAVGTTSRLSPAIRHRLVTEAEVCTRVVALHGLAAAEKFIQEVCWRSYWVGWLELRPAVWHRYCADVERLTQTLGDDRGLERRYGAAIDGHTGIDCFDAWVVELRDTGWLHNHARMNFASIWIHTLRLPWQLGADLFQRQLLDACPASNTLSWRWVAGLQTVGKTYAARADIIRATSGGRFAVTAPLATAADPLPADDIPSPHALRQPQLPDATLRTGLLITIADLSPETLALPAVAAVAVVRTSGASGRQQSYAEEGLRDALARADDHGEAAAEWFDDVDPVDAVRDWAARHRLRQVVTAEASVGPVADQLDRLGAGLAGDRIGLIRLRRDWDAAAWPMATKGFFAFKAAIPRLLAFRG